MLKPLYLLAVAAVLPALARPGPGGAEGIEVVRAAAAKSWQQLGILDLINEESYAEHLDRLDAPQLTLLGDTPLVSYTYYSKDEATRNEPLCAVKKWNGTGWGMVGKEVLYCSRHRLAVGPSQQLYMAHNDFKTCYYKDSSTTVRRYSPQRGWQVLGQPCFVSPGRYSLAIAVGPSGVPVVASLYWKSRGPSYLAGFALSRFINNTWVTAKVWPGVYSTDPWSDAGTKMALAVLPARKVGTSNWPETVLAAALTMASTDKSREDARVRLLTYTFATRTPKGSAVAPFPGGATNVNMALDEEGTPYIAVYYSSNKNRTTVYRATPGKYPTFSVQAIPTNTSLTAAPTTMPSIAVGQGGMPFVAFGDTNRGEKATVMRHVNGSSGWSVVGPRAFSASLVKDVRIAVPSGSLSPFVLVTDVVYYEEYFNMTVYQYK